MNLHHFVHRTTMDIDWTPSMSMEHRGKWACSIRYPDLKWKCWHRRRICLDCEQQLDNAILVLMRVESDQELNTSIKEYFLIFPMIICTSRYNKWFRFYEILNSAGLLEVPCWAKLSNLRNLNFWPPKQMESQETFNNSIVDNVFRFLMDIYMPSYNQRFKSYGFWKLTELLKFDSGQQWSELGN
jgi:hypothetical protein